MDTVIPNAQATFIRGAAVQPFERELNMKNGNQIVEANGAFFKNATIIKPETLIPENIKKGIDIGGIEGSFEIQGVSKTAEIDFATEYTKAYNNTDVSNFKVAENEGKYIRIMYEPYDGLFGESVEQYAYYRCDLSGSSYTLTKVETGSIPLKSSQEIKADVGTSLTEVAITKPETLISANIRKNVDIGGVSGDFIGNGYSYTINNLNFQNGMITVIPDKDKLFSEIKIPVPDNLTANNIKSGTVIAGIQGTYVSDGLPQLVTATNISNVNYVNNQSTLTNNGTGAYITVTNPTASNGKFVSECQLFITEEKTITNEDGSTSTQQVDTMVARKTGIGSTSSINFYANNWLVDSLPKTDTLKAQFLGDYFKPSNKYTQTELKHAYGNNQLQSIGITALEYNIENASLLYTPTKTYWGQYISNKITPASGYYLPKKIDILLDGSINGSNVNMISGGQASYNNTTGAITISYYRINDTYTNGYWGSSITINAVAPNMPWLKDFTTKPSIFENTLIVPNPDSRAKKINISLNNEIIHSEDFALPAAVSYPPSIANRSSTYGFSYNSSTGFYVSTNKGVHNSYAVCRATFNLPVAATVTISYINYAEQNYDFGIISKVDQALSLSNTADTSYLLKCTSSSSSTKTLSVTIPAGSHFIDFKYRKDGSGASGNDNFQFKISTPVITTIPNTYINLSSIPALKNSGTYELQISGEAEGYTGTDPVTLTYTRIAVSVDGETLITDTDTVENEILMTNLPVVSEETLIYDT